MAASTSVRRSAALVGIHPSTAFRWRHATLGALKKSDETTLTGLLELGETGFAFSEKGRRHLDRPARRRGVWEVTRRFRTRCVSVPVAYDRAGSVVSGVVLTPHPYWRDLRDLLLSRVVGRAIVLANYGAASSYGVAARVCGHTYHCVPRFGAPAAVDPLHHTDSVKCYIAGLRSWLRRFRGVATRYLDNYLTWHRKMDALGCRAAIATLARSLQPA
jgi:hypothetical protein